MIVIFLAQGFEEIEALTVADVLRRAKLSVVTVGIGGRNIRGAHEIEVVADQEDSQFSVSTMTGVVLPGGMPGTLHLEKAESVQKALKYAVEQELLIGAICAAPSILGHKGYLRGKHVTCFPGYEQALEGAIIETDAVVTDKNIVTACGAGAALPFALELVRILVSSTRAVQVGASMQCR